MFKLEVYGDSTTRKSQGPAQPKQGHGGYTPSSQLRQNFSWTKTRTRGGLN